MGSPHQQDFRQATEDDLLAAIGDGQPLALAEAYHRVVPAAHAVARRLMPGATAVEEVLLAAFRQLWETPPPAPPLEGWIRRTTWAAAADRLRAAGDPPSSPSASVLLPDLPAPDVRFLDAAERAIGDLPDDERRALLLAHDKGVPSSAQDPGAGESLVRALLALAGPESSAADRTAIEEEPCLDLPALGDWCLGIAGAEDLREVEEAIASRPGCAATSRALRRGRRRIEGLPATPDMGQRVLVTVLTTSERTTAPVAAPTEPAITALAAAGGVEPPVDADADDQAGGSTAEDTVDDTTDDTTDARADGLTDDLTDDLADDRADDRAGAETAGVWSDRDPVADTADLPASGVQGDDGVAAGPDDADPLAGDGAAGSPSPTAPAAADADWAPNPADTAELRLSDILAEDDEDDDPFADLEDDDEPDAALTTGRPSTDPYAALQDLEAGPSGAAAPAPLVVGRDHVRADAGPDVYVEGQDDEAAFGDEPRRGRNPLAALMAWILPILGGLAVGVLLAIQVFGTPSS